MRNRLALLSLILAFVLLIPGVTRPILELRGSVDKAQLVALGKQVVADTPGVMPMLSGMAMNLLDGLDVSGSIPAYRKSRSIVGTVGELFNSGNHVVGFLVMLFSIIVPVVKAGLLLFGMVAPRHAWGGTAFGVAGLISKWSMADVFVVATIVAFLAANATRDMGEIFILDARFGAGFYYFLGYCLLSILSAQLLRSPVVE
ncbi:MAG TPA: paraquat-inducible protein A [Gammaproteobacteria bacterium]|nr:paraquat-inducible protein A [Gammaproteobacteria bacterium]